MEPMTSAGKHVTSDKRGKTCNQGGDRLGGETSGSERKGVMQWTGSELKSKRKLRVIWGFGGTERGIFYPCIVVVYNLKMFWSR